MNLTMVAEHDNKMRVKSKWQPDGVEIPITAMPAH